MIMGIITMCALTLAAPGTDCSEKWTIYFYDEYPVARCDGAIACADLKTKSIHYPLWQPQVWIDHCGYDIFNHELNHLLYNDPDYCHEEN